MIVLNTSKGQIKVVLDYEKAPLTAVNFYKYVRDGHYDGTIFHRVIKDFMIQGGGYDADFKEKKTRDPITNEADNGLTNTVGTLAMARTNDPHSATAQFFINVHDNDFLNHKDRKRKWGYCVFGHVTEGLEVVQEIAAVATGSRGPFDDVPKETVLIESCAFEGDDDEQQAKAASARLEESKGS